MKQLDPKAVWLFFVAYLLRGFFLVIFLSIFLAGLTGDAEGELVLNDVVFTSVLVILVFAAVCFVWAKLTYRYYRYETRDNGFFKESGVIYKKYVTIPYDRIQNIDINRGIWARLLGLSDVQIQTAGSNSSFATGFGGTSGTPEGRLPGLSREGAEKLRDELVERARRSKNQGL